MITTGQKGFTLVELLVTIAIAAILVTAGVPAFNQFVANNRLTAQVNGLVRGLQITRSEAIKRGASVTICTGKATSATSGTCSGSSDWSQGRIVFMDADADGAFDAGADELINVSAGFDGANSLMASLKTNSGTAVSFIDYQSSGFAKAKGAFTLCDSRGQSKARAVIVSATGSVRSVAVTNYNRQYDPDLTC